MALAFPLTPSVNDEYTIENVTYLWDGYSWNSKAALVAGGGGGAWELIETNDFSTIVSSVDFTLLASGLYKVFYECYPTSSGTGYFRVRLFDGGTIVTSANYNVAGNRDGAAYNNGNENAFNLGALDLGRNNGEITFNIVNSNPSITFNVVTTTTSIGGNPSSTVGGGVFRTDAFPLTNVNGISLFLGDGKTMSSGKFSLYKLQQ